MPVFHTVMQPRSTIPDSSRQLVEKRVNLPAALKPKQVLSLLKEYTYRLIREKITYSETDILSCSKKKLLCTKNNTTTLLQWPCLVCTDTVQWVSYTLRNCHIHGPHQ